MDKKNISYTLPEIAKRFENYIQENSYDFKDDRVESVFDYLLVSYIESRGRDPKPIEQGFADLENYMEGISLEDNNAIFCLVCDLCNLYEERAFKDGLQLGAYLIMELQGK
jgi:hypothetical protein